jgi:hypothetical protein
MSGISDKPTKVADTKQSPEEWNMIKRIFLTAAVAVSGLMVSAPNADAGIVIGRVAPVRRVAYRAVLPPYPVARRAVVGPIYRPYVYPAYRPAIYGSPVIYGSPMIYGPGVSVWTY